MEFKDVVMKRYATKRFETRTIPEEKISQLLEIIRFAPSAINLQPWKIKVISDRKLLDELFPATFNQGQIKSCSHLFVFCADTDLAAQTERLGREMEVHQIPDRDIVLAIAAEIATLPAAAFQSWSQCQVHIAATYAILGATALGLGSCPMTHFKPDEYSRILELPPNLVPTILCAVGYPADKPKPRWRYLVDEVVI